MSTLKISNINPVNRVSIGELNKNVRVVFGTEDKLISTTLETWRQFVIESAKERDFDIAHFDYTSLLDYYIDVLNDGDCGTFIAITSDGLVFDVGM